METKRNFANYQQVSPADLNAIQADAETSLDDVVQDTLIPAMAYTGFVAAKTGPAQVSVASGRLYVNGKVYALTTATPYDFTSILPVASQKIVLICLNGVEEDTNVAAVNFLSPTLSTPTNPVYQPQSVALDHVRLANMSYVVGAESPNPSPPSISSTLLAVATVTLSPTGVASVANIASAQAPNLQDVASRTAALEAWEGVAAPELTSLSSSIARLSNSLQAPSTAALTGQILQRLAVIEAKDGIPSTAASSAADFFLTGATSDLANLLSSCNVAEGVRFPDDGAADAALQLFNPLDPLATVINGVLFPAYDIAVGASIGPATGSTSIAAYTYQTTTWTQKTMARSRVRYGTEFTVCTNSAFWQSGSYDPISGIFTLPDGETFLAAFDPTAGVYAANTGGGLSHLGVRLQEFWTDSVNVDYWDRLTTNGTLTGSSVEETFQASQDTWLAGVDLAFTQLAASGGVTVSICECTPAGNVDLTKVLGQVTLPFASLGLSPTKTQFLFPQPVCLTGGTRYGLHVSTAANHFIATADGGAFPNGMFFGLVGGYAIADPTKHIVCDFLNCAFTQSLSTITLAGLQLSGGITSIDALFASVIPDSSQLTFQAQVAGAWIALAAADVGALNAGGALPPLLPFRVVFQGSQTMQPCIDLLHSNVHVSRPKTAYVHVWPLGGRTLAAPSTQIRCIERYESFDPSYHAASMNLLTGVGFATSTAPSSTSDVVNDDGSVERTYVWNLGAAVSAYKYKSLGTTTAALKTFHIAWLKDWAL